MLNIHGKPTPDDEHDTHIIRPPFAYLYLDKVAKNKLSKEFLLELYSTYEEALYQNDSMHRAEVIEKIERNIKNGNFGWNKLYNYKR